MRSALLTLLLTVLFSAALSAETRIVALSGTVTLFHPSQGQWVSAAKGTVLSANDRIRTGPDGKAVLLVDETRLWIAPNSETEVRSLGQDTLFGMIIGKLRAKVKLMSGRKFSVRTPVCVASVRGTDFVVAAEGEISVLEGVVAVSDLLHDMLRDVGAGSAGVVRDGSIVTRVLTNDERRAIDAEWNTFDALNGADQASADRQRFAQIRSELQGMVADMKSDLTLAREITNEIKESDISTGRTLRDMHGNLVRVEQHILRPDNQTLEFLNLTKRSEYAYTDRFNTGWSYTGPSGARLDVMDVTMRMNMPLPEQLTEWPSYISGKGDALHPDTVKVLMTNQDDRIEFQGDWKVKGQKDNKGNVLRDDQLVFSSFINGWKVDDTYTPANNSGTHQDGHDSNQLWGWAVSPDVRVTKDGQTKYVNIFTQFAVINNNGSILSQSDFTSSSENPFLVLKQVAGEHITFCCETNGRDFFRRGNLDLVITPDAVIAIAQKLATEISDIHKDSSNK